MSVYYLMEEIDCYNDIVCLVVRALFLYCLLVPVATGSTKVALDMNNDL